MEQYPVNVIIWQNGMVMSFDSQGQQMPEWQGKYEELKGKIAALPDSVKIEWGNWQEGCPE